MNPMQDNEGQVPAVAPEFEYTITHPTLSALLDLPVCVARAEAEALVAELNRQVPGFELLETRLEQQSAQVTSPVARSVSVSTVRKLIARHGQNLAVLVTFRSTGPETGMWNFTTAGDSVEHSTTALQLARYVAGAIQMDETAPEAPKQESAEPGSPVK